ncbi:MAG: DUF1624 domain-containing protein [Flavobacteriia bacterium]|nr:DUF1624 domain-containing protein [Flavobacteriia bacterium]
MTQDKHSEHPVKKSRLKFIDIARSTAIILMLQGHFITLTFKDYHSLLTQLRETGSSNYLLFDWWVKIRGFTAPLFFTITGLVFVYLLLKSIKEDEKTPFFKIDRIQKGLSRAGSLILIGYLLQFNLKYIGYYLKGHVNDQFFAFHILQSIGFGLAGLILIYFIYKNLKIGQLEYYFLIAGTGIFIIYPYLTQIYGIHYFPENAPQIIQNIIYGPKSNFPLIPWIGYVFFGGMLGSLLFKYQKYFQKWWFALACVTLGIILEIYGRVIGKLFDYVTNNSEHFFEKKTWVYDRLAEVILLISVLIIIEKVIKPKENLFLKIGQNTFPIYILHVIILYGAIIGYSLKDLFRKGLDAKESFWGAVIFILIFAFYVKFIEIIHAKIANFKKAIILKLVGQNTLNSTRFKYYQRILYFYKKENKNNETKK